MRWLHISDLHFGRSDDPSTGFYASSEVQTWESLLDHVEDRVLEGLGPDYIFITGDLTWDGGTPAFNIVTQRLNELCTRARFPDLQRWSRVYVVPGNHDVCHPKDADGKIHFAPALRNDTHGRFEGNDTLRTAQRVSGELLKSDDVPMPGQLLHYNMFATSIYKGCTLTGVGTPPNLLTYYDTIVTDAAVGLVGINTAWSSYSCDYDNNENALPCGSQLVRKAMTNVIKRGPSLVIMLGHHPSRYIYDFTGVLDLAKKSGIPTIYLRGHRHIPGSDSRSDQSEYSNYREIAAGAAHHDEYKDTFIFKEGDRPHSIMWGQFDGRTLSIEPECQHWELKFKWALDSTVWPYRAFQGYRFEVSTRKAGFDEPNIGASPDPGERLDLVTIGSCTLATLGVLEHKFEREADAKTDALRLWEPELGTFSTMMCRAFGHWGKYKAALITSLGDDTDGRLVRRTLREQRIKILFCGGSYSTGRQFSFTPADDWNVRYNIDHHQHRRESLTSLDRMKLEALFKQIVGARFIAFDKYEFLILDEILSSREWQECVQKPTVVFETGSRPSSKTRGGKPVEVLPELRFLKNVDILTTTWEWSLDFTSWISKSKWATDDRAARNRVGGHPDTWPRKGGPKRTKYTLFLEREFARNIWPNASAQKPKYVVVTLSKFGSCLMIRDSTIPKGFDVQFHPCEEVKKILSRHGAGDLLRAALVYYLLDHTRDALDSRLMAEAVEVGQSAVYFWLTRKPGAEADYFDGLPERFEEIGYRVIRRPSTDSSHRARRRRMNTHRMPK